MGVRGKVVLQRVMIQDLVGVSEVQAEHLGIAARFGQSRVHVGAAELGTQGDHEAVYGGVPARLAADGVEMEHRPQLCKET